MAAGVIQKTLPYCRACGWDYIQTKDRDADDVCDGCGDDLLNSGDPSSVDAPTNPGSTPGVADVTFTWTSNPEADFDQTRSLVDAGQFGPWVTDTSPTTVVGAAGNVITFQIRSVVNTVSGPVIGDILQIVDTVTP